MDSNPGKIQRALLIFPPVPNFRFTNNTCELPLGVASLASWVKDQVEVKVLDASVEGYYHLEPLGKNLIRFGLSDREIINRVEELKPDLVGFSCLFSSQFPIIRKLAELVKKLDPSIVTVAGGTHPSFLAESCLSTSKLDYIVLGEGELAFSRLIDALNGKGRIGEIPGIAFRENGRIRINSRVAYLDDLAQLPLPARELFPVEKYFEINAPMQSLSRSRRSLAIITSRGCPFRCGFCSSTAHWGFCYRTSPVEKVIAELEHLKDRYRIKEVKFEEDNLIGDRKRAKRLFQSMVDRKLDLIWNTPNGIAVWSLDQEMLELMKQSGCYEITVAVESGDPWVLKNLIKKPVNLEKTREMVKVIKKIGIETCGFFIIGFPGETREQIMNTVNYARSLELDRCYLLIFTPLPGTPLAELAIQTGSLPRDHNFEDANNYYVTRLPLSEVPPEELLKIHRRAFWSLNLNLLYRHPVRFFKKYGPTISAHPEYIPKFFRALIR